VQAGNLHATDSPRASSIEYRAYPPYPRAWWDLAWESEQQNAALFQLLRQSRLLMDRNGRQSGAPQLHIGDASVKSYFITVNPLRNEANIISDAALFSHLSKNDAEATARLLDSLNIAECIGQTHLLISQLIAIGIEALDCENIEIISPTLRLSPTPENAGTRKQTAQIIQWLLDEKSIHEQWRLVFQQELRSAQIPRPPGAPAAAQVTYMTAKEAEHDLPLLEKASELQNSSWSLELIGQCSAWIKLTHMDRSFLTQFRVLADRRMSAINLAVEMYRADHNGNWPRALDELVPKYLPAVPRDPYRADNASVSYKIIPHGWPDGHDRPVLFCDAGPDFHLDAMPRLGFYRENKIDVRQYRDLTLPVH
jgi:hypothetical protein